MDTVRIFSEFIAVKIKDYLPEKFQEAECRIIESIGNNGVCRSGVALHLPGEDGVRTIYMNRYYRELKEGVPLNKIMGEIAEQMEGCREMELLMSGKHIEDYQYMKQYLNVSLINTRANRRKLLHMPYMEMEDLSMACQIEIPCPEGVAIMEVVNEIYKMWGVSKETMFGAALKNLWEYKDYTLQANTSIMEYIFANQGKPQNLLDAPDGTSVDPEEILYVLTNRENIRGASAILCPRVMNKISDLFPEGFYIIPSSIHETMIVSKGRGVEIKDLEEMTHDINLTRVADEEILSNHIYEYDRNAGRIRQALKPVEKKRGMER